MSESLLKALMKLFALASDVNDLNQESRNIVKNYLEQELNAELVPTYLSLYDKYIKKIHFSKHSKDVLSKENVIEVCSEINAILRKKQKVVILIRLLEYILADENISDHELQFLKTTSDTFNIPISEFEDCLRFLEADKNEIPDLDHILIISSEKENPNKNSKFIHKKGITGRLIFLKFPSIEMYVMRYIGSEVLFLSGQMIFKNRTYTLNAGSSIRNNKLNPIFYSDVVTAFIFRVESEKIVFKAQDVVYRFKTGNIGIQPFRMCEENGQLIGIMGGSGAGKSTLLNILNGNHTPTEGSVTLNGVNIHKEPEKIKGVIGYVSQDDLLIEELTVFQNLYYNAKLIFGNKSSKETSKIVLDLLASLGLKETAHLKVGSPLEKYISGGQRKRLNIALELIREPALLYIDEPTSGLSSRDSQNIMDLFKELTLKGKLIYVVIHQPSSDIFKLFDKLIILDVGGYLIYNGNPVEGIKYFKKAAKYANAEEEDVTGNVNPEIIFNIIDRKVVDEYGNLTEDRMVSPKQWHELYLKEIDNKIKNIPNPENPPLIDFNLASAAKQFKIFVTRDILSKLTNKQYMLINMLEAPILALILSYFVRYFPHNGEFENNYVFLENENIPAYMFMSVVVALFIGLTVSAEEIIRDQKIRKRESFLNLNNKAYLISKILIMFTISAIQTCSFIIIGNSVLGIEGMFWDYFMVLFSIACFANVLGLNISATFNSAVTIYILIPFIIIPQLIFSGVIVKFDKLNPSISSKKTVPIIGESMASRWAFEALAVNQFMENKFDKNLYPYDKVLAMSNYKKVYWIPELKSKLSYIENFINDKSKKEKIEKAIELVRNEIANQDKAYPKLAFKYTDQLNIENWNKVLFKELNEYFNLQRTFYNKLHNRTLADRDDEINFLSKNGEINFSELKNKYKNKSLSLLVTNKLELAHIVEFDNRLLALENPIYRNSESFRGHFFAPMKKIFGNYCKTFWVNLCVIWCMTFTLIVALFFDFFRKFMSIFNK